MDHALEVLVVEDNLGDFHLLEQSFAEQAIPVRLHLVENAVRAFTFLSRQREFAHAPAPDLILLDLNLPVIQGQKVLDIVRTTAEWRHLPVMVLSSSGRKKDIDDCARLRVEEYLVKPSHYDGYLELAKRIGACCQRIALARRRRSTRSLGQASAQRSPAAP
jgi:two-component system, chemotaxis family, response regulator Rcp1